MKLVFAVILGMVFLTSCGRESPPTGSPNSAGATPEQRSPTPAQKDQKGGTPESKNSERQTTDPPARIGSGGTDFSLVMKTRAILTADAELGASNIIVEAQDGVVTLNGTVQTTALRNRAGALVRAVDGVKEVKNQLRVSR